MWEQITKINRANTVLGITDECYFYDFYIGRGYWQLNQEMENFKKGIFCSPREMDYRKKAMRRFGEILSSFSFPENSILIPATTSKRRDDERFDPRLEISCQWATYFNKSLKTIPIIQPIESTLEAHLGGSRDVNVIQNNIELANNIDLSNYNIYIVDDVFTTGAHFKATKNFLMDKYANVNIKGLIWQLTVSFDEETIDKLNELSRENLGLGNLLREKLWEKYNKGAIF